MQNVILNTGGDGLWSDTAKPVRITDMKVAYVNDELDFGELRVYFNIEDWNVNELGLIYTDERFMEELQDFLTSHFIAGDDVSYSEQGMQGDNFVSCDVGSDFLSSWAAKFNVKLESFI